MEISEVLQRPYRRILIPDQESGTFTAMIAEFPGCITEGDSASEAIECLESVAADWIEAAIESGMPIPEPDADQEYSGKVQLRMPQTVHRRAVEAAKLEGVSLNTFLVSAISDRLGQSSVLREVAVLRRELLLAIQQPYTVFGVAAKAPTAPGRILTGDMNFIQGAGTVALPYESLGMLQPVDLPTLQPSTYWHSDESHHFPAERRLI